MRRLLSLAAAAGLSAGCGANAPQAPAGPDPCKVAAAKLKTRLGPELAAIETRLNLPLGPKSRGGCALVYRQRPEEMPEEIGEAGDAGPDHLLAISLPDAQDRQALTLQTAASAAPGPVSVRLSLKDITGNGRPELVSVEEAGMVGDAYRGLRIFTYAAGASSARVVFDERLSVTTPEGLTIIPDWRAAMVDKQRGILLDGAGSYKVFTWDASSQRFTLNQAATDARNPKPPAAEPQGADDATPATGGAEAAVKAASDGVKGKAEDAASGAKRATESKKKALPKLDL